MKNLNIKLTLLVLFIASTASAKDVNLLKDLDSLGGNKSLIERAKYYDTKNRTRIVQNRIVDRSLRFELGVSGALVTSASSYLDTQNLGANIDFHITPRWSMGVRYSKSYNQLNSEGIYRVEQAAARDLANDIYTAPAFDYRIDSTMVVLNWYPIYGKLNLFDMAVTQFDIYGLVGGGQMNLASGSTSALTVGAGVGMWMSQHISSRFEARYENYQESVYGTARPVHSGVLTATLGFLL